MAPLQMQLLFLLLLMFMAVAAAVDCPSACKCNWVIDSLYANCSRRGLRNYPDFDSLPVEHLDLSGNNFEEFPRQYADIDSLLYLDLSDNHIASLAADALIGFVSLRTLLLANNSIVAWQQIHPHEAFKYAPSLKQLSLRGNRLGSFGGDDASQQLNSQSLNELDLSMAQISSVGGDLLVNQLPNLQRLSLANNQLGQLLRLPSRSLRELDMSNCSLQRLSSAFIEALPSLEVLDLSHNTALQFGSAEEDLIVSFELRRLDVSFCNLDQIDLSGLPALVEVSLSGNLLRTVDQQSFANNTMLELVDLSKNVLRLIGNEAFSQLKRLKHLNLAYNEIAYLDRNLIIGNDVLLELNLSRNIIQKLTKIVSNSVRLINMSWCEISYIEGNALSGLSAIQKLDLSHNLISDIPNLMRSETLQQLNLANCRLSTIRNSSFRGFPELADLHLNGNRLTNPIPPVYFRSNKFLDQIWLGDNPWICECQNPLFVEFYDFLTAKPAKLRDRHQLRCASPAMYYGNLWDYACMSDWTVSARSSSGEKVWSTIMLSILGLGLLALLYGCFQKLMRKHKQRQNRREYDENHEELRRIRDINERMLREESTTTLQQAQEISLLPSYEDALRMPKLERPVKSMLDLSVTERNRKQLRRSQTQPDGEMSAGDDEELQLDTRQRFRSVEMLANRDKERRAQYGPHRRTGYMEYSTQSGSRRFSIEDSRFPAAHLKTQNLQSAEQIGNFQSYENSPYTKRKPKIAEIPPFKRINMMADSVEFLTDPEYEDLGASKPGSPFAKRKPKLPASVQVSTQVYTLEPSQATQLDPAVEDYFSSTQKRAPSTSTIASDFQELVEADIASIADDENRSNLSTSCAELDLERGKRKKRKNSASRRVSGNFSAAAAAGDNSSSSASDGERNVQVHKPMRETLF
ncbi:insulin-like growth factor-binding protein complex acid labile subunit [Drosophila novamexicana]|uniref:insulin-like growth factor-binding protein complex acid labile subunit n=1 Tax=Drosophila novamexicana TaxID=47314 RepID=UPI0011E5A06B|nr:insulin-like growth factor-binding protein complex acid labile subunit [Drosophila novamexicana]